MDKDNKPFVKRPEVLKKLSVESLQLIERRLLGDLPERLNVIPSRGHPQNLVIAKRTTILSSCLPTLPDSPLPYSGNSSPIYEKESPLKKSFSFRERLRMGFFGKSKEISKCNVITEDNDMDTINETKLYRQISTESKSRKNKRFWFFRNKELSEAKTKQLPIYQRSKSFELLPKITTEKDEEQNKSTLTISHSYSYGSKDVDDSTSIDSSKSESHVYYNKDAAYLKNINELRDSDLNSSISTNSASSGLVLNILKTESVENLLEEFDKAVDMFSENYLSDCEPYTKSSSELSVKEKIKCRSFNNLPSPKILQVNKINHNTHDFKKELFELCDVKRSSALRDASETTARRGSVTDWFVLEDKTTPPSEGKGEMNEMNKYRRAQKKQTKRVRRISSTKYWITPEECDVYSRDRRPPLVIPRITQYRLPKKTSRQHTQYAEEHTKDVPAKSWNWSPTSERSRLDLERSFGKATCEYPPLGHKKRLGGSTENLLLNVRRPCNLELPPSSSGDHLDVEVRERKTTGKNGRKSKSMVAPKQKPGAPHISPRLAHPSEASVILEGPLKRTKYIENGKKSKKNWIECYMTLTPTALVFYKDQKTYAATRIPKSLNTPPSPTAARAELVLPLLNAQILPCEQTHTRRYSRSVVLRLELDQYLLQEETDEGARRLLKYVQNAIFKLGPPMLEERASPQGSSNTDLESVGRTPPAARHPARARHRAGGSSTEELSDSTEVSIQKSHVKSRLRKFFAKRPGVEVLVKKGIYKDEPVFGRNLEEVCPPTSPRVPDFVKCCVREIESSEENMCTDGLYRASGNLSQVQKIRLEIDQNNGSVIENNTDIHVLTGSLKLFFRELKEPLIPCAMFDRILAACSIKPKEARVKEFRDIVQSLPQCNRDTLKYLLEHLLRVTQYSENNRMHTANLAIVFGPTLLWAPAEQAHNIAYDCIQQNNVVDILLTDFKEIFTLDTKAKKRV